MKKLPALFAAFAFALALPATAAPQTGSTGAKPDQAAPMASTVVAPTPAPTIVAFSRPAPMVKDAGTATPTVIAATDKAKDATAKSDAKKAKKDAKKAKGKDAAGAKPAKTDAKPKAVAEGDKKV